MIAAGDAVLYDVIYAAYDKTPQTYEDYEKLQADITNFGQNYAPQWYSNYNLKSGKANRETAMIQFQAMAKDPAFKDNTTVKILERSVRARPADSQGREVGRQRRHRIPADGQ